MCPTMVIPTFGCDGVVPANMSMGLLAVDTAVVDVCCASCPPPGPEPVCEDLTDMCASMIVPSFSCEGMVPAAMSGGLLEVDTAVVDVCCASCDTDTPTDPVPDGCYVDKMSDYTSFNLVNDAGFHMEQLINGCGFLEGPASINNDEYLLYTDVTAEKIFKYDYEDTVEVFHEEIGSSGLYWHENFPDELVAA
eukprot:UN29989